MILAENDPSIKQHIYPSVTGGLSPGPSGYYVEFQVMNYSRETIYVTDYKNVASTIPPNPIEYSEPRIDIVSRRVVGPRTFHLGIKENTVTNHVLRSIPLGTLRLEAVYSSELNVVISTRQFAHQADHPFSDDFRQAELANIFTAAIKNTVHAPLSIIANDPTKEIDELYISIHGKILAAKVTNFIDEPDTICVVYRDLMPGSSETHHVVKSSLTELKKSHPTVWTMEGCVLSPYRSELERHLERSKTPDGPKEQKIPLDYHNKVIDRERAFGQVERTRLEEENGQLKKRNTLLTTQIDELTKAEFSQRAVELKIAELELKERELVKAREQLEVEKVQFKLKMEAEEKTRRHTLKMEEAKHTRSNVDTLVTVVKACVVILPIVMGLMKMFSKT